jgi:hypothetical protein
MLQRLCYGKHLVMNGKQWVGKIVMKPAPRELEDNHKLFVCPAAVAAHKPIDEDCLLLWGIWAEEETFLQATNHAKTINLDWLWPIV